jgi:tRNA A37 threonylcarbamoyladenosine biosynthesis protein TsaE
MDGIVKRVIDAFKRRSERGLEKYGTTLERNDLTHVEWLQHLQEELMDATLYIEKLKDETKNKQSN